jgi:ABC-type multidrug transport system ATPase subunit
MKIKLHNISKSYNKGLFSEINYDFISDKIYTISGRNGVGKTTLLKIISKYINPDSGSIFYEGFIDQKKQLKEIGYFSPNSTTIDDLSGKEFLEFIRIIYEVKFSFFTASLVELIKILDFEEELLNQKISFFSTGNKTKIGLLASLIHQPSVIIWDEPFSGLDQIVIDKLISYLLNLKNDSRIIIIVDHDIVRAKKYFGQSLLLETNKLINND